MARSVSVPSNTQRLLYVDLSHIEDSFDFEYALEGFVQAICKRYPSLYPSRQWLGREDRGLAENDHAVIGISEYCGLGAVWVVPTEDNRTCCNWVSSIKRDFLLSAIRGHLGQPLQRIATASNGEAFFEPVNE